MSLVRKIEQWLGLTKYDYYIYQLFEIYFSGHLELVWLNIFLY